MSAVIRHTTHPHAEIAIAAARVRLDDAPVIEGPPLPNHNMPDPEKYFATNGVFLAQLYAVAVLRVLTPADRHAVLKVFDRSK